MKFVSLSVRCLVGAVLFVANSCSPVEPKSGALPPQHQEPKIVFDSDFPVVEYLHDPETTNSSNEAWLGLGDANGPLMPSGGAVQRAVLDVDQNTKLMLVSASLDGRTNTKDSYLVPPSQIIFVWSITGGWKMAKIPNGPDAGKPIIICGDCCGRRTRNGRIEWGFYWYGKGVGADPGYDVYTVIDGKLRDVDGNRVANDPETNERPPIKDLGLSRVTPPWEWTPLSGLVNKLPWREGPIPLDENELAAIFKTTPPLTRAEFDRWLALQ